MRRLVLAGAARAVPTPGALAAAGGPAPGAAGAFVDGEREGGDPLDLRIDLPVAAHAGAVGDHGLPVGVDEEVHQLVTDDDVLPQRHRPRLGDDDLGGTAHLLQPGAELLGVGDRRREGHQLHRAVEVDDDLLPHRSAQAIGQVVHLVHHHEAETLEQGRAGVQHVAQHLGGHDHDVGIGPDRGVTGQQADPVVAEPVDQLAELLVRQRLDGSGVEDLATVRDRQVHGELPDHRLAGPRRRGDEHGAAALEDPASGELEVVERELVPVGEGAELGSRELLFRRPAGVLLRGRGHEASSGVRSARSLTAPGRIRAVRGSRVRASPSE